MPATLRIPLFQWKNHSSDTIHTIDIIFSSIGSNPFVKSSSNDKIHRTDPQKIMESRVCILPVQSFPSLSWNQNRHAD